MIDGQPHQSPPWDLLLDLDFPFGLERPRVTTPEETAHIEGAVGRPHISAELASARAFSTQSEYLERAIDCTVAGQPVPPEVSRVIDVQDMYLNQLQRGEERRQRQNDKDAKRLVRQMRWERRANHYAAEARWLGTQLVDLFRSQ